MGRLFQLLGQYKGISQTRLAIACDTTQPKISGYMRGTAKVEALEVFERIADGLNMPGHARIALGLAPGTAPASTSSAGAHPDAVIPSRNTGPALPAPDTEEDEPSVRRRSFVGLTGASLFGAILADPARSGPADAIESFAAVLATYDTAGPSLDAPPDLAALAAAVARAKRDYQACRYSAVTKDLPALLSHLQAACGVLDGQARLQAYTLSAEAHHVAASILLKAGDQGLGWLAADRSSPQPVPQTRRAQVPAGRRHHRRPATYNTINKWAHGISDTYALGILAETTALNVPVVVLPFVNSALAARAPFRRNVEELRREGVHILLGPGSIQPHEPHTGGDHIATYPWHLALAEAERLADLTSPT